MKRHRRILREHVEAHSAKEPHIPHPLSDQVTAEVGRPVETPLIAFCTACEQRSHETSSDSLNKERLAPVDVLSVVLVVTEDRRITTEYTIEAIEPLTHILPCVVAGTDAMNTELDSTIGKSSTKLQIARII